MKIATLWIGDTIPLLFRLCMRSWLAHAEGVDLYVADPQAPPKGVPDGVNIRSASDVLPLNLIDSLRPLVRIERSPGQEIVSYSDIFRIVLQKNGLGFWMDSDVVLLQPFAPTGDKAWFAWDTPNSIGVSALYFPQDDPLVTEYVKVLDHPDLFPHWLGFRRGILKPALFRLALKPYRATDLGVTTYGNGAIDRLIKKQKRLNEAHPMRTFYYKPKQTDEFFDPAYTEAVLNDPSMIGIHVHLKGPMRHAPRPGSAFERLLSQYRIPF